MTKVDIEKENIYDIKSSIMEIYHFPDMKALMDIKGEYDNQTIHNPAVKTYNEGVERYNSECEKCADIRDGKGGYILLEYLPMSDNPFVDIWFYHYVYQYNLKVLELNEKINYYTAKVKENVEKIKMYVYDNDFISSKEVKRIENIFNKINKEIYLTNSKTNFYETEINDTIQQYLDSFMKISLDRGLKSSDKYRNFIEEIDNLKDIAREYKYEYDRIMICFYTEVNTGTFYTPKKDKYQTISNIEQIKMNLQKTIFFILEPMGWEISLNQYLNRMIFLSISALKYVKILSYKDTCDIKGIINNLNHTYNRTLLEYKDKFIVPQDIISEVKLCHLKQLVNSTRCGVSGYSYIKEFILFDKKYDSLFAIKNCFVIEPEISEEDDDIKFKTFDDQLEDIINGDY